MALSSTLFTGLSGLVTNQSELNVVGNNIANANTTAFKASRALFSSQFYTTLSNGSPANGTSGGSNPSQIGLGSQVASINQNFTQGELQSTGVSSDLAIDGNGFFIVQNGSSSQQYTRDGTFSLNSANNLVDTNGDYVMGYGVNPATFQVNKNSLQPITIPPTGLETIAQATQNASLTGNLNAGGAVATTGTVLTSTALQSSTGSAIDNNTALTSLENVSDSSPVFSAGSSLTFAPQQGGRDLPTQTLAITGTTTVGQLQSFLQNAAAIDPNVPSGTPGPTPGVNLVNDPSGTGQDLVITGNIGDDNALSIPTGGLTVTGGSAPLTFNPTAGGTADGESTHIPISAYDSLGNPITLDVNAVLTGQSSSGTTWEYNVSSPDNEGGSPVITTGTLAFNNAGQLSSVNGITGATGATVTVNRSGTGATPSQQITINFSGVQSLAGASSSIVSPSQDGFARGTYSSYTVGTDGTITGSYSNGLTETIGQLAVANFANPAGLVDKGNNQFATSAASGNPTITTPQSQGIGAIRAGELEMSNVDLSKEFINLIIASTGYSASSRVISTSDQLLTDLLNSQR